MKSQHNRVPVPYALKNLNAIEVLGGFRNAARESGWTAAQVAEVMREAMSGDYEYLHCVLAKYCVAPSARPSLQKIMENAITFSLSSKSVGVVEGHLYKNGEHLLSVVNPETIAAAIFAMGECKVVFVADTEYVKLPFPASVADLMALQQFVNTIEEAYFMAQFVKSSRVDFLNPLPADIHAKFNLTAAVGYLPKRLVRGVVARNERLSRSSSGDNRPAG